MDDEKYIKIVEIINNNRSGCDFSLDEVLRIATESYILGANSIVGKLEKIMKT